MDDTETKASDYDDDKILCNICLETTNDAEYLCPNNHGFCLECINTHYENQLISNKEMDNKCPVCKTQLYINKLEAILNEEVLILLFKKNIFKELKLTSEYEMIQCALCPKDKEFTFIINKKDFIQYFKCLGDECGKTSCLYCMKEVTSNNHNSCKTNFELCNYLVNALKLSKIGLCSSCKKNCNDDVEYLKGSGCTHMKCKKCNSPLCYICGMNGTEFDYDKTNKDMIFGHNTNWKTNIKRCPMYLKEFHTIDNTWPEDDSSATINLYNYKIKSFLAKLINKYGIDKVKLVYSIYKDKKLESLSNDFIDDYQKFKKLDYIENRIGFLYDCIFK